MKNLTEQNTGHIIEILRCTCISKAFCLCEVKRYFRTWEFRASCFHLNLGPLVFIHLSSFVSMGWLLFTTFLFCYSRENNKDEEEFAKRFEFSIDENLVTVGIPAVFIFLSCTLFYFVFGSKGIFIWMNICVFVRVISWKQMTVSVYKLVVCSSICFDSPAIQKPKHWLIFINFRELGHIPKCHIMLEN